MSHKRPYLPEIHESDCRACDGKGQIHFQTPTGRGWADCDVCDGDGIDPRHVRDCLDVQDLRIELMLDNPEDEEDEAC